MTIGNKYKYWIELRNNNIHILMTPVIVSITALTTVISALIYYFTLKELEKQMKNTSRPYLFIDNIDFKQT